MAQLTKAKFIEASAGIQHNVDELLVGALKQMRLKRQLSESSPEQQAKPVSTTASSNKRTDKNYRRASSPLRTLQFARDILSNICISPKKSPPSEEPCENLLVP